jgi:hypothetical protein
MDSLVGMHVLRIAHIVTGAFWVGTVVFLAAFLLPSLRAAGPAAGPVMYQVGEVRRMPLWLLGAGALTVLSGIALYWRDSAGFTSTAWLASGEGRVFGLGGALAVVGLILGIGVISPAAKQLGMVTARLQSAGRPPTPEEIATIERSQRKVARASGLGAGLLLLATVAMAVARYVP